MLQERLGKETYQHDWALRQHVLLGRGQKYTDRHARPGLCNRSSHKPPAFSTAPDHPCQPDKITVLYGTVY